MLRAMTEAIAFDTHRFVKRLTEGGFTEKQAETLADEQVALLNANLATKADIAAVQADIEALRLATRVDIEKVKADIAKVEAGLKADIAKVEARLKAEIAKVEGGVETLRLETGAQIANAEAGLRAEIAKVEGGIWVAKAALLKWMFGAMIAQGGLIVALVKLL